MNKKKSHNCEDKCALKGILDILGGRWAMSIIYTLSSGTKRYKELELGIPHINSRMLVKELKNLEANSILTRIIYPTVPPTVEYSLTDKGNTLVPIIKALRKWGEANLG